LSQNLLCFLRSLYRNKREGEATAQSDRVMNVTGEAETVKVDRGSATALRRLCLEVTASGAMRVTGQSMVKDSLSCSGLQQPR